MWKIVLFFLAMSGSLFVKGQVELFVDGKPFRGTKETAVDSIDFLTNRLLNSYWRSGYLFAGIDSMVNTNGTIQAYLHQGKKVRVGIDSIRSSGEMSSTGFTARENAIEGILSRLIDSGYPFSAFQWDTLYHDKKGKLRGVLSITPGPYIVNDTIHLLNDIKTDESFIQRTLDLRVGEPFSEQKFQSIPNRLKRIPFIQLKSNPDVGFSDGEAEIFLDLEERQASSFEGVIGFLPNQAGNNNQLLITGFVDLKLGNLFSTGRSLSFNWQQFAFQSQLLDIQYQHPYLFNSRLLVDVGFNLTKQDTTFVNRNFDFGIGTYLWEKVIFKGSYTRFSGDLLTTDPGVIENQSFADYQTDLYTMGISSPGFDEDVGFGSEWSYQAQLTAGKKNISINPSLPSSYYDTIEQRTNILKFSLASKWQKVLMQKTTLYHELNLGGIENQEILKNELFRKGGLKTLRGFNEYFFFAQYFMINRIELRQYFEERSYFMLFFDHMYYRYFEIDDMPMGLGLGFSLSTSNGLFNFAIALGRSGQQPLDFNNSKVHLGYISRF